MTAFDELLADYDRLRSGDAECNTKDRDRLVKRVAAERKELVAALMSCKRRLAMLEKHAPQNPLARTSE